MTALLYCSSCQRDTMLCELSPHYDYHDREQWSAIPFVVLAQITGTCKPVGRIHPSRWDGTPKQLWQVRVRVESFLQGTVPKGEVSVSYFQDMGNLASSDAGLGDLTAGKYFIFFLLKNNGNLQPICDGSHTCVINVRTGAHPGYKRGEGESINDAVADLLYTRGPGITDEQFLMAMRKGTFVGAAAEKRAMERLARTETPEIARFACYGLQAPATPPRCQQLLVTDPNQPAKQ